ncbi:M23 family metallopeptidase [Cohnella sp. REN36]|uniref:M23 family metallopeptidase n=1 Tax=Cohnella sp. REN36 TaxID=2887347 RepID=UPI001D14DFEF|nr:M23 family metallopeptidase [Cohnella sp. REN36]MCC3377062.1 M23 family metallopeptidase [Cohnella sp. REN36]
MQKQPGKARGRGPLLRRLAAAATLAAVLLDAASASAAPRAAKSEAPQNPYPARRELYDRIGLATGLAWYDLAAIDQYERTMSRAHPRTRPLREGAVSGVYIPPERWAGPLNPDENDKQPLSIRVFQGIGQDGSGDGRADRTNDADLLYAVARRVMVQGSTRDDFAIGVWEYYHNTRAVQRIQQFSKLYRTFGKLDLVQHVFPLPQGTVYAYRSTWGNRRGWGGARIHEGTDIFAGYGVPVRSTSYGVVEIKGWNRYGGWRIGIRDLDNLYHYYAHLSGFEKSLKPGDVVRPGQLIGWVGSSGYGKPGTQGKFPPHLHYGVYRDRGLVEWAFDPYPLLRNWERAEQRSLRVHS